MAQRIYVNGMRLADLGDQGEATDLVRRLRRDGGRVFLVTGEASAATRPESPAPVVLSFPSGREVGCGGENYFE